MVLTKKSKNVTMEVMDMLISFDCGDYFMMYMFMKISYYAP